MGSADLQSVLERVRRRVTPDEDERTAMETVADRIIQATEEALADLPVEGDAVQVGSTARDTWMSGDRDVDVFVRFPTDLSRGELEAYGLEVGRNVLPDGREEYAEHPYVTGEVDGFDVDLVPCYRVKDASAIRSAVDRSPFHTSYLSARLDEAIGTEVRVTKRFLQGIGAYGSNLKTRGFSGYLTELLVLEYGEVEAVLEAAASWDPPVVLDPEDHGTETFDDTLVVIDPTDPTRNVAAVVTKSNVARVQHFARELLAEPSLSIFYPEPRTPLSPAGVRAAVARRETTPIAVVFETPDLVDDQLYPQLRRSLDGLERGLAEHDFDVLRSRTFADKESAVLLVELLAGTLPAIERHEGPPVAVETHARDFYETYVDTGQSGPFIEEDRYVLERERAVRHASEFIRDDLLSVSLGSHVESALEREYEVLVGSKIGQLSPRFGTELSRYFQPTPRD